MESAINNANAWLPIQEPALKAQIKETVREVMKRLQSPQELREKVESLKREVAPGLQKFYFWSDLHMASGSPGLCLLHAAFDGQWPDEGWDETGHEYMISIQQALQQAGITSLSMWGGLAGVGMALRALSRGGTRYQSALEQINESLLKLSDLSLEEALAGLERGVQVGDYDVIGGWAGVGRYLLFWAHQPRMRDLLCRVLDYFVQLSGEKEVDGQVVPGWHIPQQHQYSEEERAIFAKGNFNLGLSHGIPGPLVLMSLALIQGVEVPGQREAVRRISEWLLEWTQCDPHGPFWVSRISFEELVSGLEHTPQDRGAWCYGSPGVARALWLAGNAMGEAAWKQKALEAYHAIFARREQWNLAAPTFCHGLAGLLQLTQRMYVDSGDERLGLYRTELTRAVLKMYDPAAPFGFYEMVSDENGRLTPAHKPGLLEGAAGTALVLLGLIDERDHDWDAALLIR